MNIREVMSAPVVTVTPETSLHEVARLLSEHGISGLPVLDTDGTCIGVVSEGDVLVKQLGRPAPRRPLEWLLGPRPDAEEERRRSATTAREAMTAPPVTIGPDRPLRITAELMVRHGVNRLPVLDTGRIVGIVTRADLVRAYLRQDAEIETAVRRDVLEHTMWLDPSAFDIRVGEGIVHLAGSVDRRSTARIIAKLTGLLEGVSGVESRLTWRFDDLDVGPDGPRVREPGAASITAREPVPDLHR